MKKAMMSMGEMLSAPMVPAATSSRPMAKMARRNRLAIRGPVIKLRGKTKRAKGTPAMWVILRLQSALGRHMRMAANMPTTASRITLGT